ncbi:MATE family efflux transporter [bacterium SCSIO 12643]|nr:MATE family efflux transporter [bacterium SCSIO 12643]
MSATSNFGTERISKLLLQQAIPAGIGILVLSIYSLVDTIFIGRYIGGIGIAAITIVSPITFLVSSIGLGIGMGGGSLISLNLGEGNVNRAKQILGNQSLLVLLLSAVIMGLGFLFYDGILQMFGARGASLLASQEYFFFTLWGLPFFMGQMMLNNVLRAEGNAQAAMIVLGLPSIINILLDAVFIIVLDMGLNGVALATALSQAIGVIIGVIFLLRKSQIIPSLSDFKWSTKLVKSIAGLGSVQFLSQATMSIVVVFANNLLMKYGGDLAISAYGLVIRITMFAFFPVMGIVQGFMPIAGFNYGAGKQNRVKEAIHKSFLSSTIIAFSIMILAMLGAESIVGVFTDESDLILMASVVMYWVFSAYPLLGIQQVSTAYFQAIGKARPALWLTLVKQIILIPTLFILPLFFQLDGIWYGFPISEVSTTLIAYSSFRRELKLNQA